MNSGKKDEQELIGTVTEVQNNGKYIVELTSGIKVTCYLSGLGRKPRATICSGDRVRVEVEGRNGKRGRITYRYRPAVNEQSEHVAGPDSKPVSPETEDGA